MSANVDLDWPGARVASQLYRLVRLSVTGPSIRRRYVRRRVKKIVIGRTLGRAGTWRGLWR